MAALDELRDEALSYLRNGTSVVILGHPGSGRSTIVRSAAEVLASTGFTVVEARGLAGLADRPLEALAVAELVGPVSNRPRGAVAAAVEAVQRAIGAGRSVVIVDDADELDPASIGVLAAAITSRRVPLLSSVSTARRAPELSLPALVRPGAHLTVPPLAYLDTQELMQQICGRPVHTSTVAAVQARAGGLPGLVRAITENAMRRDLFVQRQDGLWITTGDLWTPHLNYPLEPFLQRLSANALDGLVKLAHVGAVAIETAQQLMADEDLEELDDRGLLAFATHSGEIVLSVYPPLLAEHLCRERVGVRRVRLLGEIATALDVEPGRFAAGSPPGIAEDVRRLTSRLPSPDGDDSESRVVRDAVLNRLVQDNRSAQILVRRAAWEQRPDASTAVALAMSLMMRGVEPEDLEPVFATEVPADDPKGRALLTATQATYLAYGRRDLAAATALLRKHAEAAGAWAPLLDATAYNLTLFLDHVPEWPRSEVSADPLIGDLQRLVRAQHLVAVARPREAIEELEQLTGSGEDPDTEERAEITRGVAMALAGDLDGALTWSGTRYEHGRSQFDPNLVIGHGYVLALVHLVRGDDEALRAHLGPLLSIGITPLRHSQYQLGTLIAATRLAALAGRPLTARALADQAGAMGLRRGPFPMMVAEQATGHADLADGADEEEAADRLWAIAEDLRDRGYIATALMAGCRAVELFPDPKRAAIMVALAAEADSPLLTMLTRYVEALSADPDTQLQVGAELVSGGLPGLGLIVQVAAVRALGASDPNRAADESRRVMAVGERLGRSYRDLVVPVAPRSVLTSREREVAELAGSGMSNGEIARRLVVSVRTVENHLHKAFNKLGVQSRSALNDALKNAR